MRSFHHSKLPDRSALLSGRRTKDGFSFPSANLQIWYNNTDKTWADTAPHYHEHSDEIFIVLRGALHVDVDGHTHRIGGGEFCCFPAGQWHSVVRVEAPVETLMIRAPSVDDKVYKE
jgi:mannose-6-phosphate isomerase-like protein (cupin superfamily)